MALSLGGLTACASAAAVIRQTSAPASHKMYANRARIPAPKAVGLQALVSRRSRAGATHHRLHAPFPAGQVPPPSHPTALQPTRQAKRHRPNTRRPSLTTPGKATAGKTPIAHRIARPRERRNARQRKPHALSAAPQAGGLCPTHSTPGQPRPKPATRPGVSRGR